MKAISGVMGAILFAVLFSFPHIGSAEALHKVRIGYNGSACEAGLYVAYHRGFFKQAGIELRLCSMTPQIEEAFRICKFHKLIPLFPSEEKALAE